MSAEILSLLAHDKKNAALVCWSGVFGTACGCLCRIRTSRSMLLYLVRAK